MQSLKNALFQVNSMSFCDDVIGQGAEDEGAL